MLDSLLSVLAPHSCINCRRCGFVLCDTCIAELVAKRQEICSGCGKKDSSLCSDCQPEWRVERALLFEAREGVLKDLIDEYKFAHKRSAAFELATLAASLLPTRVNAVLVPVPTIPRHIRERGYDHMALLARRVARIKHLQYTPLLVRRSQTVQHQSSKRQRLLQARSAFSVRTVLDPLKTYIIFDDVTTTGASLKAAAREMEAAGARHIWTLALARQPLESLLDERG